MKTIISLENISKKYCQGTVANPVLNNFSHHFTETCFTVLAGPSGTGKSTLLNILATLDEPDAGSCYLYDKAVDFKNKNSLTELRKNNFGFVFQSFNLIPVLSALENVELPMTLHNTTHKKRREIAEEVLTLVGLKNKFHSRPAEMSGGEQQRVAIARAIAPHPAIVFADEPTANLDRKNAENIIALMKELNEKQGINFIIASHDEKVIRTGKELIWLSD